MQEASAARPRRMCVGSHSLYRVAFEAGVRVGAAISALGLEPRLANERDKLCPGTCVRRGNTVVYMLKLRCIFFRRLYSISTC